MESLIPTTTNDPLLLQGHRMLRTLKSLDPALGVQLNTPARVTKDLNAYRKAAQGFDAARTLRTRTLTPELRRLDKEGSRLISKAKNILKPDFGNAWSDRWVDAGFTGPSIATPTSMSERVILLGKLALFLRENPNYEMEKMGVTAARAEDLFRESTNLRNTLDKQDEIERDLSDTRMKARKALQRRLQGLRNELTQLLDYDDSRWGLFDMVSPADRAKARLEKRAANKKTKAGTDAPAPAPALELNPPVLKAA
jgi:hypothetical protein